MGDPQASFEKVLSILDRQGVLGENGWILPRVSLLSIGDHFDYRAEGDAAEVGENGLRLLRWLAEHAPWQVVIIAGNHDMCRVMELSAETDDSFALAREAARGIEELKRRALADPSALPTAAREFATRFPRIPTPAVVLRDWLSFSEAQRELVKSLLLGGRLRLAQAARMGAGREILFTHASVSMRELSILGIGETRTPAAIAARLNSAFDAAVACAGRSWEGGGSDPVDLSPLQIAGTSGQEGGGLLYHRPTNPDAPGGGSSSEGRAEPSRRYDARSQLPRGLLQACGHTGHRKCLRVLGDWVTESARSIAVGGLRTLRTEGDRMIYEAGISEVPANEAGLYFIDGEMNSVPAEDYPLLEIGSWIDPNVSS